VLSNEIFYHGITKKTIIAFGSLFSDIKLTRSNADGSVEQTIAVPIAYAPKEKWLVRLEQDTTLENHTYTTLPRLSFEIVGFTYDGDRKTGRMNYITCSDGTTGVKKTYAPVPYNININLYALTKTQEDGLQIIEQILPFFAPELTMSIKAVDDSNIITDVPIILNSLDVNDEYDGDFQTRRFITYTLGFTLKTWMFGPVNNGNVIGRVLVNTSNPDLNSSLADLDALGDPATGNVTTSWTENIS
jgi:hypothetical protein